MDEELGFPFDTEYLDNQSLFLDLDEGAPDEVIVWVESRDDIRLWKHVLRDNKAYTYDFRPASMFRGADGKAANGCNRLTKLWQAGEIQASRRSIFCLDSDFKYLASFGDKYSGEDYELPHFYWTRVHSKEHLFIFEDLVDEVVSHITCVPKARLEQRAAIMHERISKEIYTPFLKLLYLRSCCFDNVRAEVQDFSLRLDTALNVLLNKPQEIFKVDGCTVWDAFLSRLSVLTGDLSSYLEAEYPGDGFVCFERALSNIGVGRSNVYLFYRGHDWYAISYHIAKSYLGYFNKIRLDEIRATSVDVRRDVHEYLNQTPNVREAFLSAIPTVENVPFFKETVQVLRSNYPELY